MYFTTTTMSLLFLTAISVNSSRCRLLSFIPMALKDWPGLLKTNKLHWRNRVPASGSTTGVPVACVRQPHLGDSNWRLSPFYKPSLPSPSSQAQWYWKAGYWWLIYKCYSRLRVRRRRRSCRRLETVGVSKLWECPLYFPSDNDTNDHSSLNSIMLGLGVERAMRVFRVWMNVYYEKYFLGELFLNHSVSRRWLASSLWMLCWIGGKGHILFVGPDLVLKHYANFRTSILCWVSR